MNFFRDVVSHLLKSAFEAHTKFSVADNTAVGANPVRSISLDAAPSNGNTIISLSWDGGEKLFEKNLPEQEAAHQFDLISTDLAEVSALTKQGQYDSAKDLMKKLGQKYAENTGDIVDTNLPALHNTQASVEQEAGTWSVPETASKAQALVTFMDSLPNDGMVDSQELQSQLYPITGDDQLFDNLEKQTTIPVLEAKQLVKDFISDYLLNSQEFRSEVDPAAADILSQWIHKTATKDDKLWRTAKITMQNLWFSNNDELLEYQQKQKGAQSGGQDHIPLWDKQKGKAPAKAMSPASLSYEDVENKEQKEHEDMQNHIDEKIKTELESALQEKAASVFGPDQIELIKVLRKNGRNWDEIKSILVKDFHFEKDSVNIFIDEQRQGTDPAGIDVTPPVEEKPGEKSLTPPEELVSPETHDKLLQDHEDKKKDNLPVKEPSFTPQDVMDIPETEEIEDQSSLSNEIARADNDDIHKVAAPTDLNPLQEPIEEAPTQQTPPQDKVPMGKSKDHNAPQKGDRIFVSSDLTGEKAGFEATFISNYQSQGREFSIVETDQGDLLDVESNRIVKTSPGAQEADPVAEPQIEKPQEEPISTIPSTEKLTSASQDEALAIKKEAEQLLEFAKTADEQTTFWDERSYDEKYPMMAKHPNMVDPMIEAVKKYPGNWNRIENELFYKYPYYMMNMSHAVGSRDGADLITEVENWLKEHESTEDKVFTPRKYEETEAFLKDESLRKQAYAMKCKCGDRIGEHKDMKGACSECKCPKWDVMPAADREILEKKNASLEVKALYPSDFEGRGEDPKKMKVFEKTVNIGKNGKITILGSVAHYQRDYNNPNDPGYWSAYVTTTSYDATGKSNVGSQGAILWSGSFDSKEAAIAGLQEWSQINVSASLKKEAGTTWNDLRMPEPPQAGWRVQHKSGLTGTVVDGNDKFANVKLDQPVKEEQQTFRDLDLSWVQFNRGDHPKGVYAIYAGDGFGSWSGSQPNWTMMDSGGKPIYPKGYQPPKPMEHDKNPNPEPAIDTESSAQDTKCEECGQPLGPEAFLSKWPVCGKCTRKRQKKVTGSVKKKASTDYYFSKPVSLATIKKIKDLKLQKNQEGSIVLTDGENYVHLDIDEKGLVSGCTRFGGNDPSVILDILSSVVGEIVDEHEMQDRWYAQDEAEHAKPGHQCTEDCQLYEYPDEKQAAVDNGPSDEDVNQKAWEMFKQHWNGLSSEQMDQVYQALGHKTASDFEKGISQNKTSAPDPTEAPKTQYKDYKITPKYVPKEQAVPATPELDAVLTKMDALQQNLATLEAARKQIQVKMQEEMKKIDQSGERVQMEAQLQESIEKAGVLISAVESKVVQWKDKLFTLQTEEISYVPSLTPKEMLAKIYAKFDGAEQYVKDVLNGMLSQAKNVVEKTLVRWPNKKSELGTEADSNPLEMMNHFNEELMAALKLLSEPM